MATKRHKPEEIVTKLRQIDGSGGTRPTLKFFGVPSAFCRSELFGHVLDARLAPAIPSRCAGHTSWQPPLHVMQKDRNRTNRLGHSSLACANCRATVNFQVHARRNPLVYKR